MKQILGRWDSIAIILGIVIGVGIFRVPAEVASNLDSPYLFLLAWLLGGVLSLIGALCYAELASSFPLSGGSYVYLKESYGLWSGFLFGWTELLAIRTGSIAAVSFIFGEYICSFLAVDASYVKAFAIGAVIILSILNSLGLRYGKGIQDVLMTAKITAIAGIIVLGFISGRGSLANFDLFTSGSAKGVMGAFGLAMIPVLWTYGGWHENTFVAEETRDAKRTIPFALVWGIGIITFIYMAINILYIYLMPMYQIKTASLIGSDMLHILTGYYGQKIFEALILVCSIGSMNAMIITGSRITYAMAKDNVVFRFIGRINEKCETPVLAMSINAVIAVALIMYGTFGRLLYFTGVLVWFFFALVAISLFILRRRFPVMERPYKVWGYPVTPALFFLISVALFVNTFMYNPANSMMGLGILLLGAPVYLITRRRA